MADTHPLRILCIDGGGVRGIIPITVLRSICWRAQRQQPHEIFDLICGTSTGGILAILLGILKIPLDDCEKIYYELSKEIFDNGVLSQAFGIVKDGARYDAGNLENAIINVLKKYNFDPQMEMLAVRHPRVFVVTSNNMVEGTFSWLLRNYKDVLEGGDSDMKIWQAIRATTAAPTYFTAMNIDGQSYIDGGVGANNPTELALREVQHNIWKDRKIGCIVSLGTGIPATKPTTGWNLADLPKHFQALATNCEKIHQRVLGMSILTHIPYFRFNVDGGIGSHDLAAAGYIPFLQSATKSYLNDHNTLVELDKLGTIMNTGERKTESLV